MNIDNCRHDMCFSSWSIHFEALDAAQKQAASVAASWTAAEFSCMEKSSSLSQRIKVGSGQNTSRDSHFER